MGPRVATDGDMPGRASSNRHRVLERIMEETTAGGPIRAIPWTCKSTTRMAEEPTERGHPISQ